MAAVVPSQAREVIERSFAWVKDLPPADRAIGRPFAASVAAVVAAADGIPGHLLTMSPQTYVQFLTSREALRQALKMWAVAAQHHDKEFVLRAEGMFHDGHPLRMLWLALGECRSDEAPLPGVDPLVFVTDPVYRGMLRGDLSAATSALRNGEYKAATVIGASVVEAMLIVALDYWYTSNGRTRPNLESKDLVDLIADASARGMIEKQTANEATSARNYRNLIHPGRSKRESMPCDIATAHIVLGAAHGIIRDVRGRIARTGGTGLGATGS